MRPDRVVESKNKRLRKGEQARSGGPNPASGIRSLRGTLHGGSSALAPDLLIYKAGAVGSGTGCHEDIPGVAASIFTTTCAGFAIVRLCRGEACAQAANSEPASRSSPNPPAPQHILPSHVCTGPARVLSFPRGLCVGIYATNSAEACQYVITHARVNILLVENDVQLQKILSVSAPQHCLPVPQGDPRL